MGDRIAILREGGVLAQYDTPDEILRRAGRRLRGAQFVGADRGLKRLSLRRAGRPRRSSRVRNGDARGGAPTAVEHDALRDALSLMLTDRRRAARRSSTPTGDAGRARSRVDVVVDRAVDAVARRGAGRRDRRARAWSPRRPVIPNFGGGATTCVRAEPARSAGTGSSDNWDDALPAARCVEHIVLTLIAVGIGFVIAFALRAARATATRLVRDARSAIVTGVLYTIPSLALFQLLVPLTGPDRLTRRDRAGLLHAADPVPQHARRAARACPTDVREAAAGMGLTRAPDAVAGRAAARAAGDHRRPARSRRSP